MMEGKKMRIKGLERLPHSNTWTWRTVEGNRGNYYTYDNGKGILYQQDDDQWGCKVCTQEKFSVCKAPEETVEKLNRLFADLTDDPTEENEYRL